MTIRTVWREFWLRTVLYVLIGVIWKLFLGKDLEGDSFQLQSTVVGIALNAMALFVLIELPVRIWQFGIAVKGGDSRLIKFAAFFVPLPVILGSILFHVGRYDEVGLSEDIISVRGPSPFADHDFRLSHIGQVYLRETAVSRELVFLWHDKALQSTYVPTFEPSSTEELDALLKKLGERGVEVHAEPPSEPVTRGYISARDRRATGP